MIPSFFQHWDNLYLIQYFGRQVFFPKNDLFHLADISKELHDMLDDDYPLDDWMEAKITKAADYIRSVHQYVSYDKTGEGEESKNDHVTVYIATSPKTLKADA